MTYDNYKYVRHEYNLIVYNKKLIMFNFMPMIVLQGLVVQRWVSANPGLKFNLLFYFVYFCMSVYFKTSEK